MFFCSSKKKPKKDVATRILYVNKRIGRINSERSTKGKAEKGKLDSDFVILFEKLDTFKMNVRVDIF